MEGNLLRISMLLLAAAMLCGLCAAQEERLKLATTTSLYDTKLLDLIEPEFEEKYNVSMDTIAKGSGAAIKLGETGDVDVLLVHDPVAETKFIENGDGLERRCIAYNYFYLVGPEDDPAGIEGMNASEAMATIMEKGLENPDEVMFISRGDNSGTHALEKVLWANAGYNYSEVNTSGPWYVEAGQGMGATLMMANEKQAYTLSDMSTFMAFQGNLTIMPLIEGGDELLNVYVAMAVNPAKHPGVNCEMANEFINYLVSDEGQEIIATFGEEQYGRPLFFPAKGNCELIGCSAEECAVPTSASCATA
jgi:tungstate transport system substrate-binding protein